jgi:2-keto-4-pentenoate hydratase/2-oxohepta-3-ene-1,7-dioic acid hydratase in catechol pathway
VAVIGRETKNVSPAEAADSLFGLTCGNDVSERNWQKNDLQWLRAKGADTFAPLGPCIVRGLAPCDLSIETRVNGAIRQSARTRDLLFDIPMLISYASRYFTLLPGDVIFTGTPGETGELRPGDQVEVEIEGIGVLSNSVSGA